VHSEYSKVPKLRGEEGRKGGKEGGREEGEWVGRQMCAPSPYAACTPLAKLRHLMIRTKSMWGAISGVALWLLGSMLAARALCRPSPHSL